jgi:hypothetical protein
MDTEAYHYALALGYTESEATRLAEIAWDEQRNAEEAIKRAEYQEYVSWARLEYAHYKRLEDEYMEAQGTD